MALRDGGIGLDIGLAAWLYAWRYRLEKSAAHLASCQRGM